MSFYIIIKKPKTDKYVIQYVDEWTNSEADIVEHAYHKIGSTTAEVLAAMNASVLPASTTTDPGRYLRFQEGGDYAAGYYEAMLFDGEYWAIWPFTNWEPGVPRRVFVIRDNDIEEFLESQGYERVYPVTSLTVGDIIVSFKRRGTKTREVAQVESIESVHHVEGVDGIYGYSLGMREIINAGGIVHQLYMSVERMPAYATTRVLANFNEDTANYLSKLYRHI